MSQQQGKATGNATHDLACSVAEGTRQGAVTAGGTVATAKAADIACYRAMRASALANNCGVAQFIAVLQELGVGGQ